MNMNLRASSDTVPTRVFEKQTDKVDFSLFFLFWFRVNCRNSCTYVSEISDFSRTFRDSVFLEYFPGWEILSLKLQDFLGSVRYNSNI